MCRRWLLLSGSIRPTQPELGNSPRDRRPARQRSASRRAAPLPDQPTLQARRHEALTNSTSLAVQACSEQHEPTTCAAPDARCRSSFRSLRCQLQFDRCIAGVTRSRTPPRASLFFGRRLPAVAPPGFSDGGGGRGNVRERLVEDGFGGFHRLFSRMLNSYIARVCALAVSSAPRQRSEVFEPQREPNGALVSTKGRGVAMQG
jgi:hypothetical protein